MLIFVHGMLSNADVWLPIIDYFNERKFSCKAINLREGLNLRKVHFQDYVNKVKEIVTKEDIVIGHSMGGLIVQKVAEEADIKCGVAICSAAPKGLGYNRGIILSSSKFAPKVIIGRPFKQDYGYVRKYALAGLEEEKAISIYEEMEKDSAIVVYELGMKRIKVNEKKVRCPLLFITTKQDGICTPDLVKRLAEKYNSEFKIFDGCHSFFYNSSWKDIAKEIYIFIKKCTK
jgi:pimeloyl-ACP methyl ester carboxylesterase